MKFRNIVRKYGTRVAAVTSASILAPVAAFASTPLVDLSEVTAKLGEIEGSINDIGLIMLGAAALAVVFKWGKAAIFG